MKTITFHIVFRFNGIQFYPVKLFISWMLLSTMMFSCRENSEIGSSNKKPRNILFVFTDDQRMSAIGALGNSEIKTPNMDKLVKKGMAFTNTNIMGSFSGAVCAPSRAMLMTGRPLFEIDPSRSIIDSIYTTLPQYLSMKGYHTFHTGKWHNDQKSFARSFNDGKAIFFGGMNDHYKVPLHHFDKTFSYPKNKIYYDTIHHSTDIYANAAINFLNTYENEKPFFMYVAFQAPHDPRQAPQKYLDLYDTANISLPPNFMIKHPFDNGEMEIRDEWTARMPRQPKRIKQHIRAYYAMITHVDDQIGKIVDALRNNGQLENTLIIFAGDNGLALGQHGLMGKQNLYEHSIGVPLVFSGPEIPSGRMNNSPIYLNDIYPTLCDYLGLGLPSSVKLKSLMPIINGEKESVRDATVHVYKNFQRAIKKGDYKLIEYNVKGKTKKQLFNLKLDPFETSNLITFPEQQERIVQLESEMQQLLREIGDSVNLSVSGWNVSIMESWEDKMRRNNPEALEKLKKMAAKERESLK